MLDPWICQSVCLLSSDCLIVKAVKASINVSNLSYKSCTLLGYAKKKSIYTKYLCFLSQQFFTTKVGDLTNLGAQISCAQNRYTAVQMDLKYPLLNKDSVLLKPRNVTKRLYQSTTNWAFYLPLSRSNDNTGFKSRRHNQMGLLYKIFEPRNNRTPLAISHNVSKISSNKGILLQNSYDNKN